ARVRMHLTDVVGHTRRSQHWTRKPPVDCVGLVYLRNSDCTLFEQTSVRVQTVQIVNVLRQPLYNLPTARDNVGRQLRGKSANSHVADHHPHAGCHLQQIVDLFSRLERVPEVGYRAQVHQICANAHHVVHDAGQLAQQYPDVLHSFWYFDPKKLLDGTRIPDVVQERRTVVQTIGVRYYLIPLVGLGHLFKTAMQVTYLHIGIDYFFAVQTTDDSQSSVSSRMRWAHIDDRRLRAQPVLLVTLPLSPVLDRQLVITR